jgi:hypothetical protein
MEVDLQSVLTSELECSEQSALYPSRFTTRERLTNPPILTE